MNATIHYGYKCQIFDLFKILIWLNITFPILMHLSEFPLLNQFFLIIPKKGGTFINKMTSFYTKKVKSDWFKIKSNNLI